MSDSILSLLADELDVPPKQAKKLLVAMLREVKKRARREGVRLPEFGTFRESDGQITFEPSPSLARAVNHRFEGLQSEDLDTAPTAQEEDDTEDDGPSTITLGYQDSDWSPLDADAEETSSEDDEEPDTEEFEVPGAEEAADTEELQTPESTESRSDTDDEPADDTEELYPFIEDESDADTEDAQVEDRQSAADEERESLSGIWGSDDQAEDAPSPGAEPDRDASPTSTDTPPASASGSTEDEYAAAPDAPTSEVEIDPDRYEDTATPAETASDDDSSTGVRVAAGLLVVLLLGGAAWYVLGQRGAVQPPQETFAQLQAQIQPQLETLSSQDVPLVGAAPQKSDASSDTRRGPSESSEETSESTAGTDSPSSDAEPASSDQPAESTQQTASTTQTEGSRSIDRSAGGWTIVVGSRTEPQPAQSLVEKYRAVFDDSNLPVDVLTGTVDNQTRYRIGVGQFESRSDAQAFLQRSSDRLPEGAWPLRL